MNNYYIKSTSKNRTPENYVQELEDKLDLDFEKHESSYLGIYYTYSGLYADSIRIKHNRKDFDEYPDSKTIIDISFNTGKEKDKRSAFNHMLKILNRLNDTFVVEQKIIPIES